MGADNVGGTIYVKAGGKTLSAEGTVTVNLSGVEREPKIAADGNVYYTEKKVERFVEGTFYLDGDLDPHEFDDMTDVTCKVELGSGRQGVLNEAFSTGNLAVDTSAGTFNLKLIGKNGRWTK